MSTTTGSGGVSQASEGNVPKTLLDALHQAKLHIDTALNSAGSTAAGSALLARTMRAMDPTNTGCSNCACGGGGGGGSGCGSMRAQEATIERT